MRIKINQEVRLASGSQSSESGMIIGRFGINTKRKTFEARYEAWPDIPAFQDGFKGQYYVDEDNNELQFISVPLTQADIDASNNEDSLATVGGKVIDYVKQWLLDNMGVVDENVQVLRII